MNSSFPKIKAVLFDYGGTLDSDGCTWREQFYPIYRKAGLRWSEAEFSRYFYLADDFVTAQKPENLPFLEVLRWQVSLVLGAGRASPGLADGIARAFYAKTRKNLRRNEPLLRRLAHKYSLGIVSNFYGNLPVAARELGFEKFFDVIVDSGRVSWTKPDPRIFRYALRKLRVKTDEAVFVGDSQNRDMRGAKSIGMKHIWLARKTKKNRKRCCQGEMCIESFLDLEEILL